MRERLALLIPLALTLLAAIVSGFVQGGRVMFKGLRDGQLDRREQAAVERATWAPIWAVLRRLSRKVPLIQID